MHFGTFQKILHSCLTSNRQAISSFTNDKVGICGNERYLKRLVLMLLLCIARAAHGTSFWVSTNCRPAIEEFIPQTIGMVDID